MWDEHRIVQPLEILNATHSISNPGWVLWASVSSTMHIWVVGFYITHQAKGAPKYATLVIQNMKERIEFTSSCDIIHWKYAMYNWNKIPRCHKVFKICIRENWTQVLMGQMISNYVGEKWTWIPRWHRDSSYVRENWTHILMGQMISKYVGMTWT